MHRKPLGPELTESRIDVERVPEDDNRILECAVAGKADLIVSGDRDLQRLKVYNNIPIIRPIDALRTLGGG